jgi:ribonuclease P protein subunit RPR2
MAEAIGQADRPAQPSLAAPFGRVTAQPELGPRPVSLQMPRSEDVPDEDGQLLAYASDFRRLVEVGRLQRNCLRRAHTVGALAEALNAKDPATSRHALRVQRYALALTEEVDALLLDDPSLEWGYLLHDIGKLEIPDAILNKPGPLNPYERRLIQQHPRLGADILAEVAVLQGEGIRVVRSHHERWDGRGYPDALAGEEIPLGARIFAVADAVDAITSDRPYRSARPWTDAIDELIAGDGSQFDPQIITAFIAHEPRLRRIHYEHQAAIA